MALYEQYITDDKGDLVKVGRSFTVDGSERDSEMRALVGTFGWKAVDEQALLDAKQAEATGSGMFDPATHDVPEVLLYLDGAGHDEAQRVLDEEAGGKERKGILSQREEILAREAARDAENGS